MTSSPAARGSPPTGRARSRCCRWPETRELQERLAARGYDSGTPDGMLGTRTRTAVRGYQLGRHGAGRLADRGTAGAAARRRLTAVRRPRRAGIGIYTKLQQRVPGSSGQR